MTASALILSGAPGPAEAQDTSPPAGIAQPDWSTRAQQRVLLGPDAATRLSERQQLLAEGEALLATGDTPAALAAFERAALMLHAADTEAALVRAYMQAGEYRRALAFGAHAAGAHRDFPAATALYAWLLQAGGQNAVAARQLDAALARSPEDATLGSAREQLARPWPLAGGPLLAAPARLAPYASAMPPAAAVASAVLVDGGRGAIAPAAAVGSGRRLWLRNGLGHTTEGVVSRRFEVAGAALALVQLKDALPMPAAVGTAPRSPFAGSPAYTLEYAPGADGQPAWPLLRAGFLGRGPAGEAPLLGIDVPPGPRGGPLFDGAGRLSGLTASSDDGRNHWIGVTLLRDAVGDLFGPAQESAPRMAPDEIYESGLKLALQLLVEWDPSAN